ncbi:hypothetical protein [Hymenobacter busanensis]|nr:hypothetical protein [Hymenobacter busanensis]
MFKYALSTAAAVLLSVAVHAQEGPAQHDAAPVAGKVAVPVGPTLPGEEKLSAQERAERTFLMPPRKKMPSVRAVAPRPQLDPSSADALAIGPPTVEEMAEENAAAVKAAAPKRTYHRTSTRRRSSAHRSTSSGRKKTTKRRR